jgi:peptide methionine sulfoxide reductase MsrB
LPRDTEAEINIETCDDHLRIGGHNQFVDSLQEQNRQRYCLNS